MVETHYVDRAGLELTEIHLLLPAQPWDQRRAPPRSACGEAFEGIPSCSLAGSICTNLNCWKMYLEDEGDSVLTGSVVGDLP